MADTTGELMRRALVSACLILTIVAPAAAQRPLVDSPTTPEFLSRLDLYLWAQAVTESDPRFSWNGHWGGDFDLVDYVSGRLSFLADYEAVLGDEFQPFDPNQNNFTLAVSSSVRRGDTEIAGVLHHVSRHLGDRPKQFGVSWNVLMARVMRRLGNGSSGLDVRVDVGRVVQSAYVDYEWTGALDLRAEREVSPRLRTFAHAFYQVYAVDETVANRQAQHSVRVEGGVDLKGTGGRLELFAGYEHVVDADQIERGGRHWALAGFRLVTR